MKRPAPFGRIVTAMATPFAEDGSLDTAGAGRLARHLVEHGSDGLVLSGSTGEASTLSDDERIALWAAVRDAVEVPVVAGATSNDTRHSLELVRRADALGLDGILAVTPYYNRPSQAGIAAHFRAIAAETDLPVVLYDIPVRTGRRIAPDVVLELAESCPNVVGIKDAAGDPAGTARLLARAGEDFCCYVGDDALLLSLLAVGAGGIISVASHWCGRECGRLVAAYLDGRVDEALSIGRALLESFSFESGDLAPNPVPTKAVLRVLGLPAGKCRLPLGAAPDGIEDQAKAVLAALDAWRAGDGHRG